MNLRILVADELTEFRKQISRTLSDQSDLRIVAEAASVKVALALTKSLRPDVVVVAVGSRDLDGIDLTARITESAPESAVIVISLHADSRYVAQALDAGARAYVLKNKIGEDLIPAIRSVRSGLSSAIFAA